jgi:hypothetical protein
MKEVVRIGVILRFTTERVMVDNEGYEIPYITRPDDDLFLRLSLQLQETCNIGDDKFKATIKQLCEAIMSHAEKDEFYEKGRVSSGTESTFTVPYMPKLTSKGVVGSDPK